MKMLIIDDSKAMRAFLAHLAIELSFTAIEAVDGKDGLDRVIKNDPREPFDIALVDWDMPVMTGIEFVKFIRRNRAFDSMKIMMVTTQTSMEKMAQALEAGANDYLMKPVTKQSLEEKLQILGLIN